MFKHYKHEITLVITTHIENEELFCEKVAENTKKYFLDVEVANHTNLGEVER